MLKMVVDKIPKERIKCPTVKIDDNEISDQPFMIQQSIKIKEIVQPFFEVI